MNPIRIAMFNFVMSC